MSIKPLQATTEDAPRERNGIEPLPVLEVRTPPGSWYDFQHRYTPGLSEHLVPAPLPPSEYKRTQELAVRAHEVLRCRDLSRMDFVVPDGGEPVVLEVNSLPGMTPMLCDWLRLLHEQVRFRRKRSWTRRTSRLQLFM